MEQRTAASDPTVYSLLARAIALVRRFSVTANHAAEQAIGSGGAQNSSVAVLTRLAAADALRPRDLIESARLTTGGMSNLLRRLEHEGLITRVHDDDDDHRAVTVALTDRGREIEAQLSQAAYDSLVAHEATIKDTIDVLTEAGRTASDVEVPPIRGRARRTTLALATLGVQLQEAFGHPGVRTDELPMNAELLLIVLLDAGPSRPHRVADLLGVTHAAVTRLVDRLERDDLAVRDPGGVENDGRGVLVGLTPAGVDHATATLDRVVPHLDALLGLLHLFMAQMHDDE